MSQIDVKITDLQQVSALRNDDLFLIAHPMVAVTGGPIENYPYTSNSISGAALSTTIKKTITNENTIICSEWDYDIKIKIDNPFFGDMVNNLCSEKNIEDEYGYKPSNQNLISSSSTINGDTIVNKDYVDQLTKMLYQNIISNLISGFTTVYGDNNILQSKIGTIIHSTTFKPAASYTENGITVRESASGRKDAKMRYYFGDGRTIANFGGFELKSPDTKWILHNGYFLRGANSSQPNNNDKNSANFNGGGADSVKMTSNMLIEHSHNITQTNAKLTASAWFGSNVKCSVTIPGNTYAQAGFPAGGKGGGGTTSTFNLGEAEHSFDGSVSGGLGASINYNTASRTDNTGKNTSQITPIPTVPRYKNVYIWERIG